MKYPSGRSLEGVLQVETEKSLVLCEKGRACCIGSKGEITDPLQFHLTVLTTEFLQNVYNTLPLPCLISTTISKACPSPPCLPVQSAVWMSACCNLWIVTTACKYSEIRGNSQMILCCSALQLPGHQGIINEPCHFTVDFWPLSAGKGTDAPGERERSVCVFSSK